MSIATVSRVLNNRPGISDKAREAVLRSVNDTGYRGRAGVETTTQVALVHAMPGSVSPLLGYEAHLASGLHLGLAERHAQLAITQLSDKRPDETYTQFFLRKHIDGAVLRVGTSTREVARQIAEEGFPCVVASDRFDGEPISYVDYDSRVGMARAMDHLVELGHRRIGLASQLPGVDTDHSDRLQAYREGLERNGIAFEENLVLYVTSHGHSGASAIDQFLAMTRPPTAIVFTNPPPTVGAIRRALQRGLSLPRDLSIVGYDNADLRHSVFPSFSAVCQDAEQIGRTAAAAVLGRINDRSLAPVQAVVPTWFEANETTGAPGGGGR